jgi:hypothetical protein
MRLFESHPDLSVTKYIFNDTFYCSPESLLRRHSSQRIFQRDGLSQNATYQSCFDKLQNFIADAEAAGKVPFIKEHLFYITDPQVVAANVIRLPKGAPRILNARPTINDSTRAPVELMSLPANPTVLSNSFLQTLSPVILI